MVFVLLLKKRNCFQGKMRKSQCMVSIGMSVKIFFRRTFTFHSFFSRSIHLPPRKPRKKNFFEPVFTNDYRSSSPMPTALIASKLYKAFFNLGIFNMSHAYKNAWFLFRRKVKKIMINWADSHPTITWLCAGYKSTGSGQGCHVINLNNTICGK